MVDLSRLFRPRSVAVFGGDWAVNVITQLRKAGYSGAVWPIHPHRKEVGGLPAYADVAGLPEAPDASFIGVNRVGAVDILAALAARGAGGAVCFASGFAETAQEESAGRELQQELCEAAGDMPFLGPNCYGFVNYLDNVPLWPDQHGGAPVKRGVAILAQSSNTALSLSMQQRGLPIAYLVTVGNQAKVSQAQIAMHVLEDDRVTALGLHIEGFTDLEAWQALAARARALNKPVVALKIGRSRQAQALTRSHTASLAGSAAGAGALLTRLGFAEMRGLPAFVEALKFLHHLGPLAGRRLASLSCSGGEASLVADAALRRRLELPPLTEAQTGALREILGPLVHLSNPLDYHTYIWGDVPAMTSVFATMLAGPWDLSCLILDPPRADRCDGRAWRPALDAWAAAVRQTGAKAAVIATMPELMTEPWAQQCAAVGVAPLCGLEDGLAAIEAAADIAAHWSRPLAAPLYLVHPSDGPMEQIDEWHAKQLLAAQGLPVPGSAIAGTGDEAAQRAAQLGFPVALKALGHAHKTECGAVAVGLGDAAAVLAAARRMSASVPAVSDRAPASHQCCSGGMSASTQPSGRDGPEGRRGPSAGGANFRSCGNDGEGADLREGGSGRRDEGKDVDNLAAGMLRPGAETSKAGCPGAAVWLVEQQIVDVVAEVLIGVVADSAHGLVLTLGAGGVWTEVLRDAASLLLPASDAEIQGALRRLRIWPVLAGHRGRPGADVPAIIAAAQAVASYALSEPGLLEVEVNPYLAQPSGGVAVDALIRRTVWEKQL